MSATMVAFWSFAAIFGGAVIGIVAGLLLPDHHLTSETRTEVSVSMAVVGTMSALVLGLLISNASASFTLKSQEVRQISAEVVQLDRLLRRYGAEADATRTMLTTFAAVKEKQLIADTPITPQTRNVMIGQMEKFEDRIIALEPSDDRQRWVKAEALRLADSIAGVRWLLSQQEAQTIPTAFLVLVVCWLSIVFCSFGLFAPHNMTAVAALLLCSAAVSSGLLLIVEMDTPFAGVVHISLTPLLEALHEIQA